MPTQPYYADTFQPRKQPDRGRNLAAFSRRQRNGLRGIFDDPGGAGFDLSALAGQVPETLVQLWRAGQQADVQQQLLQLNITRAQQGLPPISLNQIGGAALLGPQVGVNVELDPQTKTALTIAAVGLGAVALFAMRRKR